MPSLKESLSRKLFSWKKDKEKKEGSTKEGRSSEYKEKIKNIPEDKKKQRMQLWEAIEEKKRKDKNKMRGFTP